MAERLEDRRLLAVVNWDGGGGDLNWNNPLNWDTDQLPGAGDDVAIADVAPDVAIFHSSGTTSINSLTSDEALVISGGTFDIAAASTITDTLSLTSTGRLDVASDISIGSLEMLSSSTSSISIPYLTGSGNVTVDGLFTWTGGRLRSTGELNANGGMQIEGPRDKYLEQTVNNAGTVIWADGRIRTSSATEFNNLAGATFDAQSDDYLGLSALGTFNNAGTLVKSGGTGLTTFYPALNNNGSVQVQSGTLYLLGGGDSNGSYQLDTDSTLRIASGTHVLNEGWDIAGAGSFLITGGTVDVAADGNIDNLSMSGSTASTLTGDGDVTVDGLFTWSGGRLQGSGKLIASAGIELEVSTKYLERTVDNAGTANWTSGTISTNANGVFNNLVGATFDAQSDTTMSGAGTFNNAGTMFKSAGTSSTTFSTAFNNSGSVQIQSGTLRLSSGGGSSSGSFQVDAGSTLQFTSGNHALDADSMLSGEGTLSLTSTGRLDVASDISIGSLEMLSSSTSSISIPYLTGSGNVTVDGLFTWTGGRLRSTGELNANGGMQIEGPRDKYLEQTVNNAGTVIWADGRIRTSSATEFNNLAGATFDAQSDDYLGLSALGTFNNAGTLVKSGGTGLTTFYPALNNNGSVQVQSGTLYLLGGGDSNGSYQLDTDSTLRIASGTHVLNEGWDIAGAGSFLITGGTVDVAADGNIDNLSMSGSTASTLTGDGDVTVDGLFTWSGGRLQGSGKLIASAGIELEVSTKYLERTVDNAGTANWTSGTISTNANGVFNNLVGATFDAQSDTTMSGAGTFNNAGTMFKSAGTSSTTFSTAFNNSGSVQIQSGTLRLSSGGGSSSGSFQVDAGSTLQFTSGNHALDADSMLSGEGTLSLTSTGRLDVASDISIGSLEMLSSSTSSISIPYLTGSGNVTVDGLFTWTGGRLRSTGELNANGGMQIEGPRDKYLEQTVNNAGTVIWADGRIRTSSATEFNNLAGATFDAQSDDYLGLSALGTFNNAGTLVKSGGTGLTTFYPALNNNGSVQVQSGTLYLLGGGDSNGSYQLDTDSTLRIASGTHVLNEGWDIAGAGSFLITGGTVDVAADGNIDNLSMSGSTASTLTGDGDVTVDGLFTWSGGRLQGSGKLIASAGIELEVSTKYLERTVDNAGTANWTSGTISTNANGVFNNLVGATFDAQSDTTMSGAGTFNNAGTMFKSAGTSSTTFSTAFNNSGSVQIQSGTLRLSSGGGSSSGSFQVDAGSTLQFTSGNHALDADSMLSGEGTLSLTSTGRLDVASDISIGSLEMLSSSTSSISIPYLTGSGNVTVDGLFTWTGGRLRSTGELNANGGMQIEGPRDKYLEQTVNNAGTVIWADGRIRTSSATEFNNLAGATFDAQSDDYLGLSALGTFNNAGTLVKSGGTGLTTFYPALNNNGSVQVQSGTLYLLGGYLQTAGEMILNGGNLSSSTPLDIQGGELSGFGQFTGSVLMQGRLAANSATDQFGSIQITGDYSQSPRLDAGGPYAVDEEGSVQLDATISPTNGVLDIQIGGLATFDQLDVTGTVTLAGPLNVSLSGGYEPAVGDSFTIVNNAGSDAIVGAFAGLPEGATFTVENTQFQISYAGGTDNNDVVLTAINPTGPDQGGDTFTYEWDLDGDGVFGETGSVAQRGDEQGASVSFSAEGLEGPAIFDVGVRAAFSSGAFSPVSTTTVNLSDSPADPLPDLAVTIANVSFSPANPNPGESVTILATIENLGQLDASDILVDVYDSDVLIEQVTIPSLAIGATQQVSVTTSFSELGVRSITVKVDPSNSIEELNEENNEASKLLQIADSIAPTTSLTNTPEANAAGWNNTDVNLQLTATDEVGGSGVGQIVYAINGGTPVSEPGNSFSLSLVDEGIHTVTYYAVDNALNVEAARSVQVRIDKSDPIPTYSGPFVVGEGSDVLPDGSASSDPLSGVQSLAWAIDGGEFVVGNPPIFSSLDGPGTQDVLLRVTDRAGNQATITSEVTVNNVAPTATIASAGTFTFGQNATVSLIDAADPSPADTAAGFAYSFGLSTGELASTYAEAGPSSSWSSQLAVGDHTVYARIFDRDDGFTDYETTVTVEQATLTVTANDITKTYDNAVFSDFTVSYTGFVAGDDPSVLDGTLNFSGTAVDAIDAGVYTIEAAGLTSENYVVNFASGQLSIEKADANIVANGKTATYDGTEHTATGSVTGVNAESLAGLELSGTFIDAPGGTATWTFTDATGNYNDASGSVAIDILKADQTINWATPDPVLQGTPLSEAQLNATVSVVGPALAGELTYAPDFGTVLGIGVNELTVTAAETTNYLQATGSVSLTVLDPNTAPTIELTQTSITAEVGVEFTLAGSFTDPDPDIWTGTVNYGDGSGDQPLALDGKNFQLAHTYDADGPYVTVITIDDGKGGVTSRNLTVVVQPPPKADLTLISSNVLFDPINPNVGDPVNFAIDVTNDGDVSADGVTVSVQVYDATAEDFVEIDRTSIGPIAANAEAPVTLTWDGSGSQPALPGEAYLLVRVVLDPDNTLEEEDESNNDAIQVLQVGSPDFGTATLSANVSPFTTTRGTYTAVGGQAYYDFSTIPGNNDFPVQNASVTARLIDAATGEVLRVSSDQTSAGGGFFHVIRAPEVDGTYTLQYEVNEGTLSAVFETTLTVSGEPTDPPPRPRGPGGPGYVFSASVVPPESLEIGVPATILGSFNYELDDALDVGVTFNNLFPVAGQLRTFEIGSTEISFPEGGVDEPIVEPMQWTPTAEGYHILQVVAEPAVPLRAHLRSTQLVLVGDLDTTSLNVEYNAVVTGSGDSGAEGEEDGSGVQAPSPGDRLLFALTYENTGTTTITGGFLMDDFDQTLVGTPFNVSDGGIVDGNAIRWNLGDIAPGETGFVTYEVIINSGAEFPAGSAYLLNTAILNADQSVTATTSEIVISNNAPVISGLNVDSFVDENGDVTLTGTFSDASIEDTHQVVITWDDGTSDTLTLTEGERSFSIGHTYDLASQPGVKSFQIAVTVTDGDDQSTGGSVVTEVLGSPPVADVGGPYTLTVGDSLTLDASESADPDGDPLNFAWDLNGDAKYDDATGAAPTITWQSLVAAGIDAPGEYEVSVRVTAGADTDIASTTLTVLFATPTITIDWTGGIYSGSAFVAAGSVIGFDDTVIGAPTLAYFSGSDTTGDQLASAPVAAGTYTVQAAFAGDALHTSASAMASIEIAKADATIVVNGTTVTYDGTAYGATGTATGVAGETLAGLDLGASFTDAPGGTATWTFTDATGNYNNATGSAEVSILKAPQSISWDRPDAISQGAALGEDQLNATASVVGPAPAGTLSYDPPAGTVLDVGFHTLTVSAAETQNYLPATASVELTVSGATIVEDSLLIVGTNTDDNIVLSQFGRWHLVTANFLPGLLRTKSFSRTDYDRIEVYTGDGHDSVLTLPNFGHSMLIDGGAGNDHLVAGRSDDVLVGGDGNDVLIGGQGRDLLIGGRGADQLFASSGSDLLIAGYTAFDSQQQALLSISAEWSSSRNYNNRRENLLGTNEDSNQFNQRLNDNYFLIHTGEDRTVFDDQEQDDLFGGGGRDWYFASLVADDDEKDRIFGLGKNEDVEELD